MNNHSFGGRHPPPQQQGITIDQIFSWRLALDQIKEPTEANKQSIVDLDKVILEFTASLKKNGE